VKYELVDMYSETAVIKVIGVGGGGGNAVSHMVGNNIEGVEFICANTDAQALRKLNIDTIIQLGVELTKGLGAGTNPEIGRQAAEENKDRIKEVLQGADMVFLTAGMGGGTGTGAIPVIAQIAREMGILTVAVVTKPFLFEGTKKQKVAEQGIIELEKYVDSLITIPNQKLLPVLGNNVSLIAAFKAANDVLLDAVQGITQLIVHPGMINVDFADVRTVMTGMGAAIMGTGSAVGDHRAREAAEKAIACPLLEDINLQGARGILVNISAADMGIAEFNEVGNIVHEFASEDAIIKIGTAIDASLGDEIKVTVVATGMGMPPKATVKPRTTAANAHHDEALRHGGKHEGRENRYGVSAKKDDVEYLDIPAFLRRQAD
jgi:cell division protein FtsZ